MEMRRELTVEEAAVDVVGELDFLYQIVYLQAYINLICRVISCKTINFISLKLLIAKGCQDQLPDDYSCSWTCSNWAPKYCDDDWSQHSHCVGTPSGKIKDSCREACGICG